ncbi:MAG: hypothetical protein AB1505_07805 [Candidatus Latescibacterota bacterium]
MRPFDIAPFALPAAPPGEIWFEEMRDVTEVVVRCRQAPPRRVELHYWQRRWPRLRAEEAGDTEDPARFGWTATDDWFNGRWRRAAVRREDRGQTFRLRCRMLRVDRLEDTPEGYDVPFRRTMGLRLVGLDWSQVRGVEVLTASAPEQTTLCVELDAGRRTRGQQVRLTGYNARPLAVGRARGVSVPRSGSGGVPDGCLVKLRPGRGRRFEVTVDHMHPAHPYCGDAGLLEFHLDHDTFTVSLEALRQQGPVWYAEEGIYIARSADPTSFAAYRARHAGALTINQQVAGRPEHSLARAFHGQPRPHAVAYSFGCKHSPQRFWLDPNGDLLLHKGNLTRLDHPGPSAARFACQGNARFFFGLEEWVPLARHADPPPVPVYTLRFRRGGLEVEQEVLCVPLGRSILEAPDGMPGVGQSACEQGRGQGARAPVDRGEIHGGSATQPMAGAAARRQHGVPAGAPGELSFDEVTVALVRFRFRNAGDQPVEACLRIGYSEDSQRSRNVLHLDPRQTEHEVPRSPRCSLEVSHGRITSLHQGRPVLRATCQTEMPARADGDSVVLQQALPSGEGCEVLLRVPYLALEEQAELEALQRLDFDSCRAEVAAFWRQENARGAQLAAPVPQLDALHAAHLTHVEFSDFSMPDDPHLINTSVGSSTYGNFSNESCMIVQELDQRGFHADCQRRLELWVKYQGSKPQPGNFSDYDGMYFGAGGFESGHYNQHHGWVVWCLAEHFLLTRDREWFGHVADSLLAGVDWIARQRRLTMGSHPRSRGWEHGFLPAGSLEDVTEFYYWLSTNSLTWRGVEWAARALEAYGHEQAARVRAAADAYGEDLRRGFETMRQHTPLVRLRDGRWVPHYPSRLYCRGRDQGWIREVLEGAVYLLISGLYDPRSRQAGWILDDYQDTLYLTPPYGYVLRQPEVNLFNRGGFSIQPCLLAGLLPHLERDEVEVYLWMFFNAFAAIYRDEISGMIEHPMPELGYSNAVSIKTSDEANAVMWLRYLYVYCTRGLLHFGRALPRAWLAGGGPVRLQGVCTHYGPVGIEYRTDPGARTIGARVELGELRDGPTVRVRFRHPQRQPVAACRVDGREWTRFSGEDVDLTGLLGTVEVEAAF